MFAELRGAGVQRRYMTKGRHAAQHPALLNQQRIRAMPRRRNSGGTARHAAADDGHLRMVTHRGFF